MLWPSTLPAPEQDLNGQFNYNTIYTQMDTGRRRARRRSGARQETMNLSWLFTEVEYATFREFVDDDLQGGSEWFDIMVPDGTGSGTLVEKTVRFSEARFTYGYKSHMNWRVTAPVEVFTEQTETPVDPDLMPLLYQRVQEKTDNYTLQFTDLNSLITANPGAGETLVITLPLNAGFSDKFSCGVVNIGLGEVHFVAESSVVLDSVGGFTRIFQRFTPTTVTYIGTNRFLVMGSLY